MWHRSVCLLLSILTCVSVYAAVPSQPPEQAKQQVPLESLFAMLTKYYVAIYRTGPQWTGESEKQVEQLMKSQTDDIKNLIKAKKLLGFVRVTDSSEVKGIIFFPERAQADVRKMVEQGAAVKSGLLKAEIYEVWGTHGLGAGPADGSKGTKSAHYLTVLSKGPIWTERPSKDDGPMIDAHATNVMKLKESGTLKFYGSVGGSTPVRNVSIVSGKSAEEVKNLLAAGPLIKKGWFSAEVHPCVVVEGKLP
jgi:hypothetical protein